MHDRPAIILNTRPALPGEEEDGFAAAMAERGLRIVDAPLTLYRDLDTPCPQGDFTALALTSRHGVAALRRLAPEMWRDRPVYCVGDVTAAAAVEAGCDAVYSAEGDVKALAALIAQDAPKAKVLYPCAADIAPGSMPAFAAAGLAVTQWPVYAMDPAQALPDAALAALSQGGAVVPFFSGRAAEIFARLLGEAGAGSDLPDSPPDLRQSWGLCIARRMVKSVECLDWKGVLVAARPDMPSMIAEIDNLIARQGRIPA